MATYEFKSMQELAQKLYQNGHDAYKRKAYSAAKAYADCASIVEQSVIVPDTTPVPPVKMYDASGIGGGKSTAHAALLGTVTTPVDPRKLTDVDTKLLLKVASDAYTGRTGAIYERAKAYEVGDFIAAIKAVRIATGWGLAEAKDWCDANRSKFE